MKEAKRFSGSGGDVAQRISLFSYMTSCGEGFLDLSKILTVAEQNGVEYFFFEQDIVQNSEIALKKNHLKELPNERQPLLNLIFHRFCARS
jgi:hypothetical protein